MSSRVCRLCRAVVAGNRSVYLFSSASLKQRWGSRISELLFVTVAVDDGISQYMCEMCKNRLVHLEKAVIDLELFRELVICSASSLGQVKSLKRTKTTSGEVGVSPDTARQRPSSKLARKRLTFACKSVLCIYYVYVVKPFHLVHSASPRQVPVQLSTSEQLIVPAPALFSCVTPAGKVNKNNKPLKSHSFTIYRE